MRFVLKFIVADTIVSHSTNSTLAESSQNIGEHSENDDMNSACALQVTSETVERAEVNPPGAMILARRLPLIQIPLPPSDVGVPSRKWKTGRSNYSFQHNRSYGSVLSEIKTSIQSSWVSRPLFRAGGSSSRTSRQSGKIACFNEQRNVTYNPDPNIVFDDEFTQRMWWNIKDRGKFMKRRNREVHLLLTLEENESYRQAVWTVSKFCQNFAPSVLMKNGEATPVLDCSNFVSIKDVHKAVGMLVKSRNRGLERIIAKSLQIQQSHAPTTSAGGEFIDRADENVDNTTSLCIRKCILSYQQQLRSSATSPSINSDDANENNHCVDSVQALASYCQSLEHQSRSVLWAQMMATGDAAIVKALKKRSL